MEGAKRDEEGRGCRHNPSKNGNSEAIAPNENLADLRLLRRRSTTDLYAVRTTMLERKALFLAARLRSSEHPWGALCPCFFLYYLPFDEELFYSFGRIGGNGLGGVLPPFFAGY